MREHLFEKRGIQYRTNEFRTDRQTLVFIHGLSGSSSAWFFYESFFADAYNLITLDLRGHGLSTKPKTYEDYSLEKSADDVRELLQHLQIEKYILISHSYGALVALELLHAHQEKISSIVFLSPALLPKHSRRSLFLKLAGNLFRALPPAHKRVDYSRLLYTKDWDLSRIRDDVRVTSLRVFLYCLAHVYKTDSDMSWHDITVPTLILHGTEDTYVPISEALHFAGKIKGSKVVALEKANHIIVINNKTEVSREIEAFLRP